MPHEVNQVEVEDIDSYVQRYGYDSVEDVTNNDVLFEAFSEMIVELNPNYEINSLCRECQNSALDTEEFFELKLDQVLSEEVQNVISYADYKNWVRYSTYGFSEYREEQKE